jgi:CoA:oxalate CoA-transferase
MDKTGPLDGLIVIDLSRVLAGPYATMLLADLGARVIKVEMPEFGDDGRHFGPYFDGKSAYFSSLNRGKRSIALNLKQTTDRGIFEQLVCKGDVLVENFRPGTMDKLGYGWEALQALNERLIYAAVSGFGHTGPYRQRPAYDMVVQAMGGIMSVTGQEDSAAPTRVGTSVGDITTGLFGATGILAALHDRQQTGAGMMIDVGMFDCQVAILENAVSRYLADGEIPKPLGARHPSITPFESFRTQDDYVIVAAGNNALFEKFCVALKRDDLLQAPEFSSNDLRTKNHARLKQELEATLAQKQAAEWLTIIADAGVPCGPINNIEQVVNDKHIAARNMIINTKGSNAGGVRMAGNPIKLSAYEDPGERRAAPDLDADRDWIIDSFLAGAENVTP